MHLDAPLGASEAQTEAYLRYAEGALELATKRSVKSTCSVSGLAKKQAMAILGCIWGIL